MNLSKKNKNKELFLEKNIKKTKKISKKEPHILEIKKIKNSSLNNSTLQFTKEFSPLSGYENKYEPEKWNNDDTTRETHNCYSYALGKIVKKLESKAQPGYASGFNSIEDEDYTCSSFKKRLEKDTPGSYIEGFDNACLPGFYKIFLALDVKNDYHWWKQDNNEYWSHKPGSTEVSDVDASGNKIKNPLIANRNYDSLNYYKPCFFACVYSDLARSIDEIYH